MTHYPWLQQTWQQIQTRKQKGELPHALLLTGAEGLGKRAFAQAFAESLLCQQPQIDDTACGQCRGCQLVHAHSHPDLIHIQPEEVGKAIKIDQIRKLIPTLAQTSHQEGYKVVIIDPADGMNVAAANALLKTLEEPTANTQLLLVSHQPAALPATLRSRCQFLIFQSVSKDTLKTWLGEKISADNKTLELLATLSDGAPLRALKLYESGELEQYKILMEELAQLSQNKLDPVALAAQYGKADLSKMLVWLMNKMTSLIQASLENALPARFDSKNLYQFYDKIIEARRQAQSSVSLNQQLLLEGLFIQWPKEAP